MRLRRVENQHVEVDEGELLQEVLTLPFLYNILGSVDAGLVLTKENYRWAIVAPAKEGFFLEITADEKSPFQVSGKIHIEKASRYVATRERDVGLIY